MSELSLEKQVLLRAASNEVLARGLEALAVDNEPHGEAVIGVAVLREAARRLRVRPQEQAPTEYRCERCGHGTATAEEMARHQDETGHPTEAR